MQAELGRLAHGADEQQHAGRFERRQGQPRNSIFILAISGPLAKISSKAIEPDRHPDGEDAEREAEIADPVDDEGLDGGGIGRRPIVPEADQQVSRR